MNRLLSRARRDERGASLILAIAFMLTVGGIGAAVVSSVTSGLAGRVVLDTVRNRQYAADAGVERAIAAVRAKAIPGFSPCGQTDTQPYYQWSEFDGFPIRVDCVNVKVDDKVPTVGGFPQFNVIFTACEDRGPAGPACGGSTTPIVIRAQVNYEGKNAGTLAGGPKLDVKKTWVQSWSVNG